MNYQNENKYLFRVAQKAFKAKNMLNIESNIEATKNEPTSNYYSFLTDVIFLKITQKDTFKTKNQIVMQMDFVFEGNF